MMIKRLRNDERLNKGQERSTNNSEASCETERKINQTPKEGQFEREYITETAKLRPTTISIREETQRKLSHLWDAEGQAGKWEELRACTTPTQTRSIL